jgi:hypothetical protein
VLSFFEICRKTVFLNGVYISRCVVINVKNIAGR